MASMPSLRSVVRLPARPALARPSNLAACAEVFPGLSQDDVINVTGGAPDGSLVFGVVRSGPEADLRDGWLPGSAVRLLDPGEAAQVPPAARLTEAELLQRVTLVRVVEGWQEPDLPAALAVRGGDLLQLGSVRDGWGYAWQPESRGRRGWVPLAVVQRVEPTWGALATRGETLSPASAAAVVDLLREQQQKGHLPPTRQAWESPPPPSVLRSAQRIEKEWKEAFARREADERERLAREAAMAAAEAGEGELDGAGGRLNGGLDGDEGMQQELLEDDFPLVVCKVKFTPPKGTGPHLLALNVGDLVRVTSVLTQDVSMYRGFLERKQSEQGWFPRKSVSLIEDRWDDGDGAPARMGAPPLPQVPQSLQRMSYV